VTGGITQIFELRAGRGSNALSGGGIVISPSRSPTRDATTIAAPNTFVPAPGGSVIQARAVDASIQERVADGPRIVFTGDQQLISVMGFDGGQYGVIGNTPVDGLYPSFSPDGAQVVFQRNVGGSSNIFVMNDDGTSLHQITTTTGQDTSPAWSPTGTKLVFASRRTGRRQIFTMNIDGTSQVNISNSSADDSQPAWSFNGNNIAFKRAPQTTPSVEKIWTMTSTGGAGRRSPRGWGTTSVRPMPLTTLPSPSARTGTATGRFIKSPLRAEPRRG
jgi:TolB protein